MNSDIYSIQIDKTKAIYIQMTKHSVDKFEILLPYEQNIFFKSLYWRYMLLAHIKQNFRWEHRVVYEK